MLCKKMVQSKGVVHPCGQCTFCRINSKREWIARLLLEAACHPVNQFWTLTYEQESLPTILAPQAANGREPDVYEEKSIGGDEGRQGLSSGQPRIPGPVSRAELDAVKLQPGTLFKPDLARFFKRIRKNYGQFRYFAVGEYGERLGRPHYHVLAFGLALSPQSLRETWKMGHVHIGDVESASINYCVEYSLKSEKSQELIDLRRIPEFSVMSTNPGIGAYALGEIRQAIFKSEPLPTGELIIPDTFRVGGKEYPIPRYLRQILMNEGFSDARQSVRRYLSDKEVMHALLSRSKVARDEFKKFEELWCDNWNEFYYQQKPEDKQVTKQRLLNAESRQRLFGKRHETL